MDTNTVSAKFPYQSNYVQVFGSRMHFIDEGEGDPIIFLHGIPTSSYLWRNIIPHFDSGVRCIAPDLIGMGKSDKPNIEYRIFDHIKYIEQFINVLDVGNKITFVMHGWGTVIGFAYAAKYPERVKALAFYEPYIGPSIQRDKLSLPVQQLITLLRNPKASYNAVINGNYLINKLLQAACLRKFTDEELNLYRQPFLRAEDRIPLWQFINDLPFENGPKDVIELITNYSKRLTQLNFPKLLLYSIPGFLTTVETINWCHNHLPNLTSVDLGDGLHLVQEYQPRLFAEALVNWYSTLSQTVI